MKLSEEGALVLIEREGVKLKAYKDSVGVWTIGVGHTSAAGPPPVHEGLTITEQEAWMIFGRDIQEFENAVTHGVKRPILQHQYDAYVSFCYNVGGTSFHKSHSLKLFNEGKSEEAGHALMGWSKPPEIIPRRRGERDQFLGVQCVARVDEAGKSV